MTDPVVSEIFKRYSGYEELNLHLESGVNVIDEDIKPHEVEVDVWWPGKCEAPEDLLAFRKWLDELIETIPKQYRERARIEGINDLDESVLIHFSRPLTADEQRQREHSVEEARKHVEAHERREYERLKEKFEGDEVTRELRDTAEDLARTN